LPAFSSAEQDALDRGQDNPGVKAILQRCAESLALLREAALVTGNCDWGLDKEAGPDMAMPQARPAQQLAKAGCLAAQHELQEGDAEAGQQDLLAVLMLGRRMGNDLALNSVLIQFAIEYRAIQTCADDFGLMPRTQLNNFADSVQSLPERKTLAESLLFDKQYMLGWYETRVEAIRRQNLNEPERAMGLIAGSFNELETGNWSQRMQQASVTNADNVLHLLRQAESYYDEAAPILKLPFGKFDSSMGTFRDRLKQDPSPFAKVFLSPFVTLRTREKEFRATTALAMLEAGIRCKLHGPGVLNGIIDPVSGQPFSLASSANGFTLSSAVMFDNQMVSLTFRDSTGLGP
jgi:hypothetical protein